MNRNRLTITIVIAIVLACVNASRGDLLGDSVSGSLVLNGVPTAFTSGPTATVVDPGTEFQFTAADFELTADFKAGRQTFLEIGFVRTGGFGEAPPTTWIFSDLNCVEFPACEIVGIEDLGEGALVVQSAVVIDPHRIEITTAATSGGPANQRHLFRIVTSHQPTHRSGWIPNVGTLADGEHPLGDLWTFTCKPGQTVSVLVDTKDDADQGSTSSGLDPVVQIIDGTGMLRAIGDDDVPCSYAPVCNYRCPRLLAVPCGEGKTHSIIVRDFGSATANGNQCSKGGGYEIDLTVLDDDGHAVAAKSLALGGGPARKVPRWAAVEKKTPGPALDDEDVPRFGPSAK